MLETQLPLSERKSLAIAKADLARIPVRVCRADRGVRHCVEITINRGDVLRAVARTGEPHC